MACVSSVSYQFLLNGETVGFIKPERGLRQGDPLSPYLFLICAEGLSSLIRKAELEGLIHGLGCGRSGPRISHLFFADDSLLFFKANFAKCVAIKNILQVYETISSQAINLVKSTVCFSRGSLDSTHSLLANVLGVPLVQCHEKYLGLPSFVGRSKKSLCQTIVDRV
ncbi:hypothetical protein ACOSQ4_033438 [Xanthoceras sorbifolium]